MANGQKGIWEQWHKGRLIYGQNDIWENDIWENDMGKMTYGQNDIWAKKTLRKNDI